MGPPIFGYNAP